MWVCINWEVPTKRISSLVLVNFIEERPYVDYVEDLILNHTLDPQQRNVEMVRPTKQVSILVSARKHDIDIIGATADNQWTEDCGCQAPIAGASNPIIIDNRDAWVIRP